MKVDIDDDDEDRLDEQIGDLYAREWHINHAGYRCGGTGGREHVHLMQSMVNTLVNSAMRICQPVSSSYGFRPLKKGEMVTVRTGESIACFGQTV